jgi:hypothetical protein
VPSSTAIHTLSRSTDRTLTRRRMCTTESRLDVLDVADADCILVTKALHCDGSSGMVSFAPVRELQRPGLLLQNGHVIIGWAGNCESSPMARLGDFLQCKHLASGGRVQYHTEPRSRLAPKPCWWRRRGVDVGRRSCERLHREHIFRHRKWHLGWRFGLWRQHSQARAT